MPKDKTKNTFYYITWEVNSLLMKCGQFVAYFERNNFIKKFYKKFGLKTNSRSFCVSKELSTTSTGKSTYIGYVIEKLPKLVQTSMLASSIPFYIAFFENIQRAWT